MSGGSASSQGRNRDGHAATECDCECLIEIPAAVSRWDRKLPWFLADCAFDSVMLHLVNYSFSGLAEAERCLGRLNEGDMLLFIANGVFSVVRTSVSAGAIETKMDRIRVFALMPDVAARGIPVDTLLAGIRTVDYAGFVGLAVEHGPVQSWFK